MTRPIVMLERHSRRSRGLTGLACMTACTAALLATPATARAGKFDQTLDLSIHARARTLTTGAIGLRSTGSADSTGSSVSPTHARLTGRARSLTPMFRANLSLRGLRMGLGVGFTGYHGLRLRHDPLPPGHGITRGRVAGIPLEGFIGYAFGERVRPLVEARTTATVTVAQARLTPGGGPVQTLRMHATTFGVAARIGVVVALSDYVFLDAGVGRVLLGPGEWTASLGVGIPIPLSNL